MFVDLDDINKNKNIREKNQIKYVALSRASHTATVLSFKTGVENKKNTYVDPVIDLDEINDNINLNLLDDEEGIDGSIFDNTVTPSEIVDDKIVDEFMKHCKGI